MIIVISGEDTFRSREFLRATIENFKKKRDSEGLNVHWFDASEDSIFELKRQEGAGGLFGEKRLFVVHNILKAGNHPQEFKEFIAQRNTDEGSVLCFFVEGDPFKEKSAESGVATALKVAKYQYAFGKLSGRELTEWIEGRLAHYHGSFEPKAQELFSSLAGNDLWFLDSELAKLSAYAQGRAITVRDVETLSSISRQASTFELVDALFARDQSRTARGIAATPESDYPSTLALVAGQFRTLGWLKEYLRTHVTATDAATALSIHPFVVKKLSPFHTRLTFLEIETILGRLRKDDGALKSTPVDWGAVFAYSLGSIR